MDISSTKWSSNTGVTPKNSLRSQSVLSQYKQNETNVSFSSLAIKLKDAQRAIDNTQFNQLSLSWNKGNGLASNERNEKEIAAAKWEFENLSKGQLETIALDPSGTFSNSQKVSAYEQWHVLDQMMLSDLQRNSLKHERLSDATASFEDALQTHVSSFSALSKMMVSEQYVSNAQSQFAATVNEHSKASSKNTNQSEHYYAVMVKEIFAGDEPDILSGADGMSLSNASKSPFEFLTQEDRELLSGMYEYVDQNDIDFKYIKRLASDLGDYRKHNNGKLVSNFNDGHFDASGRQLTVDFTAEDRATIDYLLSSDGLSSSKLDQGFISFMTEPGLGALSHVGSYQFLQHMVEVTGGIETSVSATDFKTFKDFSSTGERYVLSTSGEAINIPEPDVVCKNGHCEVTEKGRQNGVILEQDREVFQPAFDSKSASVEFLMQQLTDTEKHGNIWYKWLKNE